MKKGGTKGFLIWGGIWDEEDGGNGNGKRTKKEGSEKEAQRGA
jgi:hypothetical protein